MISELVWTHSDTTDMKDSPRNWLILFGRKNYCNTEVQSCFLLHTVCQTSSRDIIWMRNVRPVVLVICLQVQETGITCWQQSGLDVVMEEMFLLFSILMGFVNNFFSYFVLYTYLAIVFTIDVRLVLTLILSPRGKILQYFLVGEKTSFPHWMETVCIIFLYLFFFFFFPPKLVSCEFIRTRKKSLPSFAMLGLNRKYNFLLFLINETNTVTNMWAS